MVMIIVIVIIIIIVMIAWHMLKVLLRVTQCMLGCTHDITLKTRTDSRLKNYWWWCKFFLFIIHHASKHRSKFVVGLQQYVENLLGDSMQILMLSPHLPDWQWCWNKRALWPLTKEPVIVKTTCDLIRCKVKLIAGLTVSWRKDWLLYHCPV